MNYSEDIISGNEKKKLNDRYVELARGSCADESRVVGDEVIIKSHGEVKGRLKLRDICSSFRQRIDNSYNWLTSEMEKFDLSTDDDWEEVIANYYEDKNKDTEFIFNYIAFIVTCEKVDSKLKSNNPEFLKLKKNMMEKSRELHSRISQNNVHQMVAKALFSLLEEEHSRKIMKSLFNEDTTFSLDDGGSLVKQIIPRDEFREDRNLRIEMITAMPTEFVKKLEKMGYITEGEYDNVSPKVIDIYGKDLNYEGKYLSTRSCVAAYMYGLMDLEHLKKNFGLQGLFHPSCLERNNNIDFKTGDTQYMPFLNTEKGKYTIKQHADIIMQILDDVQPDERYSQGFWNYYMNGIFTVEQMEKCAEGGYLYIPEVCEEYIEKHRIANYKNDEEPKEKKFYDEVDFIFDDDEKVYEFFTPKMVVSSLMSYRDEKVVDKFINQYIKEMYKEHGKDFSEEIYKALLDGMEEDKYSTDKRIQNIIDMYTDSYIGIDQIKNHPLSDDELEELRKQGIENRLLVVDLYNNNFVNQDDLYERYEEEEILGMINRGMNPNVLIGYYGTKEIINFVLSNKINNQSDLSMLRPGINIEDIKSMYQAERSKNDDKSQVINGLSYEDLNMLVTCRIITKEEADEIDQAYDYKAKVDKLIEQGLIVGDKDGKKVARNEGDGYSTSGNSYGVGKIGELDKFKLLSALDEDSIELELKSDVLRNYSLIIMPNTRIAIMEPTEDGKGASYVMSIKLALEQISNSENIDGEEIVDPLKEYANRTGIRSIPGMETVNHRENWGYNLKKKMEAIHPNMNDLIYSRDKEEQEKNTRRAKIEKMQKEIQTKYLQEREKAKNFNNVEVE